MKILITSGGTKIPIDRVRDITNMSKGTFGSKIATEYLKNGHEVIFMKSKGSKTPFNYNIDLASGNFKFSELQEWARTVDTFKDRYSEHEYDTFDKYAEMLKFIIGVEQPDVVVLAAAVSDYGVENYFNGKIRSNDLFNIKLKQLPKLIMQVKDWMKPGSKLVGFKMLVDSKPRELIAAAQRSLSDTKADMIVANDLQDIKDDNHKLYILFPNGNVNKFEQKDKASDPNYLAKIVVNQLLTINN